MADYPALHLWTDAYLADTLDLSLEEHGAYLKLMMIAWRSPECGVPDDDRRIATMLGVTHSRWVKVLRPKMERFWTVSGGFLTQKRLTKERAYLDNKREQQRRAGKSSALKRKETKPTNVEPALQRTGQRKANEPPNETATPIPIPIREETPTDVGAKKPDVPPIPEFLKRETKGNGRDKSRPGTRMPADIEIDEGDREYARSRGHAERWIDDEWASYVSHFTTGEGRNKTASNWHGGSSSWARWCRNEAKWAAERLSSRPGAGGVVAATLASMDEGESNDDS